MKRVRLNRRTLLQAAAATAALGAAKLGDSGFSSVAFAQAGLSLSPPQPFTFEGLKARAESLSRSAYTPPLNPNASLLDKIDYETHGKIRYKPDLALFANGPGQYPVTFFHLGRFFQKPMRMHVVKDGQAQEVLYDPALFDMPADSPAQDLPKNAGFAGFRFQESRLDPALDWRKNDWVAFLGASYFRAIGSLYQYGLSARGILIDAAVADTPEEFPDFTHIYIETPQVDAQEVTITALLDGPSITGAYRFVMRRGAKPGPTNVTMDIETALFLRRDVKRFGIAPLTSMMWFSESEKPTAIDWRPEVHDSDGLALWTGTTGERIWRPLNNPPRTTASAFSDVNPRGFGLLQRDRMVDHYLDGVRYERRPSLWVEPKGSWGRGSVQLIEIPTDDEIHDNIVAAWVPAEPAKAGNQYAFSYRLYWAADEPTPTPLLGRCVSTRLGRGGQPGQPRPKGVEKFIVEFLGPPLAALPFGSKVEPVLTATRGTFSYVFAEAVPDEVPGHWRAQFDLTVTGADPVDLRCYLKTGDQVLTETWLFQHYPA